MLKPSVFRSQTGSNTALTRFLNKRIDELKGEKTQRQIAAAAGYDKPNIFSMFKRGDTKIPIDKIPAIARALDVDVAHLFRLGVETHWPDILPIIDEVFGRQLASKNEFDVFISKWRAATGELDPKPSAEVHAAIDKMLAEVLKP